MLSMTFDPKQLARLAEEGRLHGVAGLPDHAAGETLRYAREVANAAVQFAEPVQRAAQQGTNRASYPDYGSNTRETLGRGLATVARLVRGGLQTRMYLVSASGSFDTHAGQPGTHARRMQEIADAISTFYADLARDGLDDRVLTMTFSEFGRTIHENGSRGTDHGAGGPMMLFGPALNGGFYGQRPDLSDTYNSGLRPTTDYRSVYSTVLRDWFGVPDQDVQDLMGGSFGSLDGLVEEPIHDAHFGETVQHIPLRKGSNLISLPLVPSDLDPGAILEPIANDVSELRDPSGRRFIPGATDSVGTWDVNQAYVLHMKRSTTLDLHGTPIAADRSVELEAGWNHVPYWPMRPLPVADALNSIEQDLVIVKDGEGRVYQPSRGVDQLGQLEPGKGYKIYVSNPALLTYPSTSA
jgi:hypothetical protein